MIVACATDDGINFVPRHFGDALMYNIYKVESDSISLINTIENTSEEEKQHADPKKAKGIVSILKEQNVDVALTKVFGPNIKRISKHLLPVIATQNNIATELEIFKANINKINELLESKKRLCFNLNGLKEIPITTE